MSIAQFDSTSASKLAAQIGSASAKTTTNGDFARLLSDAQLHAQENQQAANQKAATQQADTRRADAAAATAADRRAARSGTAKTDTSSTESSSTDGTDKSHAAHHAHRADASNDPQTADASTPTAATATATATPALPTAQPPQTAAATDGSTTDGTDGGTGAATGATAQTADGTASTGTGSGTTPAATTAAADAAAAADPAVTTLAALGLGRSAIAGTGGNVLPAAGKAAIANVSVTRAPAAVRLAALTTALPQEIDGEAAATPNPTTVALNPAAASAAANANASAARTGDAGAAVDPNAPADPNATAQTALPADFATALATASTATGTTDPAVTIAATTTQHGSLFAQGGTDDTATGLSTQASGTAPAAAGFATVNAGTTVSRADAAETPSQNGQTGQAPLPLPAEQLAVAINRNAGQDGSQNFTIKLSPEKLGSVEVQLKVDSKGKTTANFVVEHAETLGLLKQDSQQLVQSLQNAGIDTNGASLSFSLRDPNTGTAQNQSNGSQGRQTAGGATDAIDGTDTTDQPTLASNRLYDLKA